MAKDAFVRFKNVTVEVGGGQSKCRILSDVCITLPKGTIVGMIGPSGSGKTTFIRTLLSIMPVTRGKIEYAQGVIDERGTMPPHVVGYMPQDTALSAIMTSRETFHFFGRMYGLSKETIDARIEELKERIHLPAHILDKYLYGMSGGQMRRISLGVTLLHKPSLLILDEPTAGSDPLTRVKIWNYLEECRNEYGCTILITTHYIDEVAKSDSVGYMYQGQVLFHDEPKTILKKCGAEDLEEATKVICLQLKAGRRDMIGDDKYAEVPLGSIEPKERPVKHSEMIYLLLKRRLKLMTVVLIIWSFFGFFNNATVYFMVNYVGNPPKDLSLCVYNEDLNGTLTEPFIKSVKGPKVHPIMCDYEEAVAKSRSGETTGYLHIKEGFTKSLQDLIYTFEHSDDIEVARKISFYADHSDRIKTQFIRDTVERRMKDFVKTSRINQQSNETRSVLQYFKVEPIDGIDEEDLLPRAIIRGTPIGIMFFLGWYIQCAATGYLVLDYAGGYYERQKVIGIEKWDMIWSTFIAVLIQPAFMFLIFTVPTVYYLGFPFDYYFLRFMILMYASAIPNAVLGLLWFGLTKSPSAILWLMFAYNYIMTDFIGWFWPAEAVPYFMQPFKVVFPVAKFIPQAQRLLARKDEPFWDPGFYEVVVFIVIGFTILRFRFR